MAGEALPGRDIYTVSRLNIAARTLLEAEFPALWVEGEISNLARPASRHLYFSLKDELCQVRCAMFRMANRHLRFSPENGAQVLVRGRISLYPERGEFQLIVEYMEQAGAGALRRSFEALKARLAAEGLFDPQHKQPLPNLPTRLGVITSPTGAAIQDILTVLRRRFPATEVIIYPVRVQGDGAGPDIARMIAIADQRRECDALILARGGGSLEDLWAFNEEVVARAIYGCRTPLVTGVGHETDFTIADFVADQRAATPSAAAELTTPDQMHWRGGFAALERKLFQQLSTSLRGKQQALTAVEKRLRHPQRRLMDKAQRVDELLGRMSRAAHMVPVARHARLAKLLARLHRRDPALALREYRARCAHLQHRVLGQQRRYLAAWQAALETSHRALGAMSPLRTLERGYAIVARLPHGEILRSSESVKKGDTVNARLARGALVCTVDESKND